VNGLMKTVFPEYGKTAVFRSQVGMIIRSVKKGLYAVFSRNDSE